MIINMGGNVFASKTTPGMSWNGLGAKYSSAFFSVKFEAKEMIHFFKKIHNEISPIRVRHFNYELNQNYSKK